MNEKFNKNAKVEQLTKMLLSSEEEKGVIVKYSFVQHRSFWVDSGFQPSPTLLKVSISVCPYIGCVVILSKRAQATMFHEHTDLKIKSYSAVWQNPPEMLL